jgi:SPRY domain
LSWVDANCGIGWHKHSIAYTSSGHRRHNQPFHGVPYAPSYHQGDVIGVGYRPRTGTIFFTRNGKKLDDVAHGLKSLNLFPTVGANGPCTVHVNFGQLGFVFIEANVKKWGLAPMTGSLAPPPPYGSEQGSILLESGQRGQSPNGYFEAQGSHQHGRGRSSTLHTGLTNAARAGVSNTSPTSPGPGQSPTDISLSHINFSYPTNPRPIVRENSPPPDYTSQSSMGSSSSEDGDDDADRRRAQRAAETQHLLGRRSPTPAYKDVVRDPPFTVGNGGRSRSGSAPAGPSSNGRRF